MKRPDVRKTLREAAEPQPLPRWWGAAQIVAVVALVVFIAAQFGDDRSNAPDSGPIATAPTGSGAVTAPAAPDDSTGADGHPSGDADPSEPATDAANGVSDPDDDGEPNTGSTVAVRRADGGTADIDRQAVEVATAAALAQFTGDFSEVPVADGTSTPQLNTTHPNATAGEPVVSSQTAPTTTSVTLIVPVDIDEDQRRATTVTVVAEGGHWAWQD